MATTKQRLQESTFSFRKMEDIAYDANSTGVVAVDGAGSTWTNIGDLYVGNSGTGTASVTGGGAVTAKNASVDSMSILAVDVGRGSSVYDRRQYRHDHQQRHNPHPRGGGRPSRWHPVFAYLRGQLEWWRHVSSLSAEHGDTNHKFTASSVDSGTSGSEVALDLASVQRTLISYNGPGGTNWSVGAIVFLRGQRAMTFTATAMTDATLDPLRSHLTGDESVLSGWTFSTTGYDVSSSNPVYRSFKVGAGYPSDDLELWHYAGSIWTPYTPTDLTYDGTFASFTATGLSGYAVTRPSPSLARSPFSPWAFWAFWPMRGGSRSSRRTTSFECGDSSPLF